MGDPPKHNIAESIGHATRGTTIVEVTDLDLYDENTEIPIVELIQLLQDALESIPEEFRNTAVLCISGGDCSVYASVKFIRPETDGELADRRRWLNGLDYEREARDRREFDRLKQKYG